MSDGVRKRAASPMPSLDPCASSWPANVVTMPSGVTRRMPWFCVSATYAMPLLSTTRPRGIRELRRGALRVRGARDAGLARDRRDRAGRRHAPDDLIVFVGDPDRSGHRIDGDAGGKAEARGGGGAVGESRDSRLARDRYDVARESDPADHVIGGVRDPEIAGRVRRDRARHGESGENAEAIRESAAARRARERADDERLREEGVAKRAARTTAIRRRTVFDYASGAPMT